MLCNQCNSADATVHLTSMSEGRVKSLHLCVQCARTAQIGDAAFSFVQVLRTVAAETSPTEIVAKELRRVATGSPYPVEAYEFVRKAVGCTYRMIGQRVTAHVSGTQLLRGFQKLAIERFGTRAREQLRLWGITETEHVGDIVFRLVDANLLGKTPEDTREDFKSVFDFAVAFPVN